jgi:XTP/dITP diphosphohydrolase
VQTGEFALADDSGLEVVALGGAPGAYSARYAGVGAAYDAKMTKLLDALNATGDAERRASFVCAMAIADPNGRLVAVTEGACPGVITTSPRGAGGFGYDPIFVPDGFDLTFGELDPSVKQEISHRSRAARLIMRYLPDFIAV